MKVGLTTVSKAKRKSFVKISFTGVLFILCLTASLAQPTPTLTPPSAPAYEFTLSSVNFVDCIQFIKKDAYDDFLDPYIFNHWTQTETKPVAYSSEAGNIKVKAKILFTCSDENPGNIWIRGVTSSNSVMFAEQIISPQGPSSGSYLLNYIATAHSEDLTLHEVKFIESFSVKWQYAFPPEGTALKVWIDIENGVSENTIYVTHKSPKPEDPSGPVGYQWLHALFKTSCVAANGLSDEAQIVDKVWEEFVGKQIKSGDEGLPIHYYNIWLTLNTNSNWLLYHKDGQCGSHVRLFLDMLKVHGIQEPSTVDNFVFVIPTLEDGGDPSISEPTSFFIKNWQIADGPGVYGGPFSQSDMGPPNYTRIAFLPHKFDTDPSSPTNNTWIVDRDVWLANSSFNWWLNDMLVDETGVGGQSTSNPLSYFGNHQLAFHNNKYLDAAYGINYSEPTNMTWQENMENESIFAYSKLVKVNKSEAEINTILNLGYDIDIEGDGVLSTEVKTYYAIVLTKDKTLFKLKILPSETKHH